jgi:hypothetical protein
VVELRMGGSLDSTTITWFVGQVVDPLCLPSDASLYDGDDGSRAVTGRRAGQGELASRLPLAPRCGVSCRVKR